MVCLGRRPPQLWAWGQSLDHGCTPATVCSPLNLHRLTPHWEQTVKAGLAVLPDGSRDVDPQCWSCCKVGWSVASRWHREPCAPRALLPHFPHPRVGFISRGPSGSRGKTLRSPAAHGDAPPPCCRAGDGSTGSRVLTCGCSGSAGEAALLQQWADTVIWR